uniref:Uncharacterized protein n=1 Tax=Plectus sambesii TaxID=2011161 RepID=A0A914V8Z2_9BILA
MPLPLAGLRPRRHLQFDQSKVGDRLAASGGIYEVNCASNSPGKCDAVDEVESRGLSMSRHDPPTPSSRTMVDAHSTSLPSQPSGLVGRSGLAWGSKTAPGVSGGRLACHDAIIVVVYCSIGRFRGRCQHRSASTTTTLSVLQGRNDDWAEGVCLAGWAATARASFLIRSTAAAVNDAKFGRLRLRPSPV